MDKYTVQAVRRWKGAGSGHLHTAPSRIHISKSQSIPRAVGGNVNWWPLRRTVRRFLKTLKIVLLYDPTISFLGIYLEKTKL